MFFTILQSLQHVGKIHHEQTEVRNKSTCLCCVSPKDISKCLLVLSGNPNALLERTFYHNKKYENQRLITYWIQFCIPDCHDFQSLQHAIENYIAQINIISKDTCVCCSSRVHK